MVKTTKEPIVDKMSLDLGLTLFMELSSET